jgi:YggT family protein
MTFAIQLINLIAQLISLLVIVQVALSYFVTPYHPVRQTIDRIMEPLLAPIRRMMPQTGMIDFSPLVLIILVQIIARLLVSLLTALY